jgi:hypothetical protein
LSQNTSAKAAHSLLIAGAGAASIAWVAALGFLLTLALQRFVPGT